MLNQIPDKILDLFFDDIEIKVLKCFFNEERILDFDLSERLKIPINDLRKILQEFNYKGFMNYDKIKSDKRDFWYDYIWYLKKVDFYTYLYKHLKILYEDLERKINICSKTIIFVCPKCNVQYPFAEALEYDFKCPNCGTVLEEIHVDIKKYKENLKFYKYWLDKIKKFAKEEESLDIEEIINRCVNQT